MDDSHISTDTTCAATPSGSSATSTPPKQQSVIDQAKDAARKLLATITGHNKS
jgi:hypothetical protein